MQPGGQADKGIKESPEGMGEMGCQDSRACRVNGVLQALQEPQALFLDHKEFQEPQVSLESLGGLGIGALWEARERGVSRGHKVSVEIQALPEPQAIFLAHKEFQATPVRQGTEENGDCRVTEASRDRADMRGLQVSRVVMGETDAMGCQEYLERQARPVLQAVTEMQAP